MTIVDITEARSKFSGLFNKVLDHNERIIVRRHGREKVAIVPIEDLKAIQQFERSLAEEASEAFEKSKNFVTWDEVEKQLEP